MLARESEQIDADKSVEEPLSEREIAILEEHFRFLQAHRRELRLKVNAAEDLLLNGVRRPSHRGVCQHLLAKVDRASVHAAAERLDPSAAAKLLAGVIRFTSEIEFVLLFLEKIRLASSPVEATAALARGLERIDFSQVSSAQMRRVLSLITELFGERQQPEILLGLLESPSFRDAFDMSIPDLPEALAKHFVPLRAVQAAVLHRRPNEFRPEILGEGVALMLDVGERTLLGHPPAVRDRLFRLGVEACQGPMHAHHRALDALYRSFPKKERRRSELGMLLARHLLAAEDDTMATKILKDIESQHPGFRQPARWLEILAAPRIDRFALARSAGGGEVGSDAQTPDANDRPARLPGHWLEGMRPVSIYVGAGPGIDALTRAAGLFKELCIPGVVQLHASGMTQEGQPYFVVPNPGSPLDEAACAKSSLCDALQLCVDTTRILAALALAGVALPDARLARFERETQGRGALWLTDLFGAQRASVEHANGRHLALARELCEGVLDRSRLFIAPVSFREAPASAGSCAELANVLANTLAAIPR